MPSEPGATEIEREGVQSWLGTVPNKLSVPNACVSRRPTTPGARTGPGSPGYRFSLRRERWQPSRAFIVYPSPSLFRFITLHRVGTLEVARCFRNPRVLHRAGAHFTFTCYHFGCISFRLHNACPCNPLRATWCPGRDLFDHRPWYTLCRGMSKKKVRQRVRIFPY